MPAVSKRIVIVEPNHTGHHFYYVRLLAERALSRDSTLTVHLVTTELASNSFEFEVHLAHLSKLQIVCLARSDFTLKRLSKSTEISKADLVTFPDTDRLLPQLAAGLWKMRSKTTFLVMRADGEPRKIRGIGTLIGLVKKSLIVFSNLRKNVTVYSLKSPLSDRKLPIPWISDPITIATTVSRIMEIQDELSRKTPKFWVGIFGYITPRKNLGLILDAIMGHPRIGLVIAGTIDESVQKEVSTRLAELNADDRLFQLSGPLNEVDLDSAIGAVHCVVAAHSNDGPSGIVAKAALLGKSLALAGAKTLKRDAEFLGDQAIWSKLDADGIELSILALIEAKPTRVISLSSEDEFASKLIP